MVKPLISGQTSFTKDNMIVEVIGNDGPYVTFFEFKDPALISSGIPLIGFILILETQTSWQGSE